MPVCRFFLKGYCRYGTSCRFDHPGENNYSKNERSNSASNFSFRAALNNNTSNNNNSGTFSFTQALQQGNRNSTFSADDVDMSEGLATSEGFSFTAFRQQQQAHPLASIFSPAPAQQQHIYQQHQQIYLQQQQLNYLQQQQQFQQNSISTISPFHQQSIAGQAPSLQQNCQLQNNLTNQKQTIKRLDFSDQQELSPEELEAFQSAKFEYRKIPIRPPPEVFC